LINCITLISAGNSFDFLTTIMSCIQETDLLNKAAADVSGKSVDFWDVCVLVVLGWRRGIAVV